ncbi:hypothetical protein OAG68_00730 [bacterium]|nr:hypothetical protein [bacterium]
MNALAPPANKPNSAQQLPSLSLFYLLALVTSSCIMFGVHESIPTSPGEPSPENPFWKWTFRLSNVFIGTLCITGLVVVLKQWTLSKRFAPWPGYQMLLIAGSAMVFKVLGDYFLGVDFRAFNQPNGFSVEEAQRWLNQWNTFKIITLLIVAALTLQGFFKYPWWWKITFGALTTFYVSKVILLFLRSNMTFQISKLASYELLASISKFTHWVFIAFFAALTASVIIDLLTKCNSRKDWVHWLGIAAVVVTFLLPATILWFATQYLSAGDLYSFE